MKNKIILKFHNELGLSICWFKDQNNKKWFLKELEHQLPIIFNHQNKNL